MNLAGAKFLPAVQDAQSLFSALEVAWTARFADGGKDLVVVEDVLQMLSDAGVPYTGSVELLLQLLGAISVGGGVYPTYEHHSR